MTGQARFARRALVRWAWRMFRREWRQQLLVLALMTVAVAAAVAGASMVVNAASAVQPEFGQAQAMARIEAADPAAADAAVAAARARFGPVEVIGHRSVAVPGSVEPLDLRAQDPNGRFGRPTIALVDGRYPSAAGEVALTAGVAELLSADIGNHVELGGVELTVVGRVENPLRLDDRFGLVAPGDGVPAESLTLLFDDVRRDVPDGGGVNFGIMVRGDTGPVGALVLVATALAMTLVGLVAAAGFVVVAQRRQRQLGLLAAIGATERHLRLVTVANGVLVGATAALVGGALGVVGWVVAAPAVETAAGHRIDRLDLPWGLIVGCMALAVAMATVAAWWPARSISRLPIMTALSGRPPRPARVRRSLALAVVLLGLGGAGIVVSGATGDHPNPLALVAGTVAIAVGVVFAAPAAIRALAAPARRLPLAARLALRDLVRYQARAAAALAAITLGLGLSVAVVGIAKANEYRSNEGNLSDRQLLVHVPEPVPGADPTLDRAAARIGAVVPDATVLTLDVAMNPTIASDVNAREPIALGRAVDAHTMRFVGFPPVATPELLGRFGIDPARIGEATDLLTGQAGDVKLIDIGDRSREKSETPVQRVALPSYSSAPTSLITEAALARHGWVRARAGWLVESPRPLTVAQIAAARSLAGDLGLTIETRSTQDGLATLRTVATAVGALFALAILAMTIGLIRSESAGDLRTLTATGAGPATRRALTATTAGALALLGVILGTAGAYAALAAGYHADLGRLTPLPVAHLLLGALGLPVVAAAGGWLLAGREPRTFARQALD